MNARIYFSCFLIGFAMVGNAQTKTNFAYNVNNYKNPAMAEAAKKEASTNKQAVYNNKNKESGSFYSRSNYKQPQFKQEQEDLVPVTTDYNTKSHTQASNYKFQFRPRYQKRNNQGHQEPMRLEPVVRAE